MNAAILLILAGAFTWNLTGFTQVILVDSCKASFEKSITAEPEMPQGQIELQEVLELDGPLISATYKRVEGEKQFIGEAEATLKVVKSEQQNETLTLSECEITNTEITDERDL